MKYITYSTTPFDRFTYTVDRENLKLILNALATETNKRSLIDIYVTQENISFQIEFQNIKIKHISTPFITLNRLCINFNFPITDNPDDVVLQLSYIGELIGLLFSVRGAKIYQYKNVGSVEKKFFWQLHNHSMQGFWNGKIIASDIIQRLISKTALDNHEKKNILKERKNGKLQERIWDIARRIENCVWMIDHYEYDYDTEQEKKIHLNKIFQIIEDDYFESQGKVNPKKRLLR